MHVCVCSHMDTCLGGKGRTVEGGFLGGKVDIRKKQRGTEKEKKKKEKKKKKGRERENRNERDPER